MGVATQDTGHFNALVGRWEYPLREYWVDKYVDEIKNSFIPFLYTEEKTDRAYESITELVGTPEFTKWEGEYTAGNEKEGNSKIWTPFIWQSAMKYDRFLLDNATESVLKTRQEKFAYAAARVKEACAAGLFTYADQTSFSVNGENLNWTLTADGLPLASNAHTSANYSGTQDNLLALELSEENLETACQAMFEFKDENGNGANMAPDTLLVPLSLRKKALEIVGSTGKVDTGDNNVNIYDGSLQVAVWKHYGKQVGKTGLPWCVIDSKQAKMATKWFNRLPGSDDYELKSFKDDNTETWTMAALMWFTAGMYDWRGYCFSIPA